MKKRCLLLLALSLCIGIFCCSCSAKPAEAAVTDPDGGIALSAELDEEQSDALLNSPELLPIGTVVTVGDGTKKLMITGLLQVKAEDDQTYDYSAVLYPEGYLGPADMYLFNKDQISRVYHLGFVSQEQKENNQALEQIAP